MGHFSILVTSVWHRDQLPSDSAFWVLCFAISLLIIFYLIKYKLVFPGQYEKYHCFGDILGPFNVKKSLVPCRMHWTGIQRVQVHSWLLPLTSMPRLFLYKLAVHLLSHMGHGPQYVPCIVKLLKLLALKMQGLL